MHSSLLIIYIPALAEHYEVVAANINILISKCQDPIIAIVTPDVSHYNSKMSNHPQKIQILDERLFVKVTKEYIAKKIPPTLHYKLGWYFQQFLKYDIVLNSPSSISIIVDADTILLNDPLTYLDVNIYSAEYNQSYFNMFKHATGYDAPLKRSSIVNFMLFNREVLGHMISHVEKLHSLPFCDYILSGIANQQHSVDFSEYELYANWYQFTKGYQTRHKFRLFRRADLIRDCSPVDSLIPLFVKKNYEALCFESKHARSFVKTLIAKFILFLGLDYW